VRAGWLIISGKCDTLRVLSPTNDDYDFLLDLRI